MEIKTSEIKQGYGKMLRKLKHQFIKDVTASSYPLDIVKTFIRYNSYWAAVVYVIRREHPAANISYGLFHACIYRLTQTNSLPIFHRSILEACL